MAWVAEHASTLTEQFEGLRQRPTICFLGDAQARDVDLTDGITNTKALTKLKDQADGVGLKMT